MCSICAITGGAALRRQVERGDYRLAKRFDWLGVWFGAAGPDLAPRALNNHRDRRLRLYEQARLRDWMKPPARGVCRRMRHDGHYGLKACCVLRGEFLTRWSLLNPRKGLVSERPASSRHIRMYNAHHNPTTCCADIDGPCGETTR